ncbi:retrovirus-related pol polyprotein from transposon TNT 1-94 [Tanacetum coccineum]
MRDTVVQNYSHVKFKKTEVEDHHMISSISNKTNSVTACNESLKSKTLNVIVVCATCEKCVFNSNHDACVSKFLYDMNARSKKPQTMPIGTRKPIRIANKSVATPPNKTIASESTIQKSKSYYRILSEKTIRKEDIMQLILFIADSGCTKHMTGNLKLLCNFIEKFLGFITSKASIIISSRLVNFVMRIWRLSHLNFDYINLLSKKDIVIGLPKLKYVKDQQYSSCELASKLPLFFWAEAIATACYTQNRSIIIPTHENTAYHIINNRKPSFRHLHIFGCTCYLTRDDENLDKMKEKGDPCILVGYSTQTKGYRVYNKRTRLIVESIHIKFDEIKEMTETSVENNTSGLIFQRQKASDYDNSGPVPQLHNVSPPADTTAPSQQELDLLFDPLYDEFFNADGFVDPDHPKKVYRFRKALYGLKQAQRAWYDELSNFLMSKGFTKGLQIHQSPRGIFINQAKYALKILKKHGMDKCDSIGTPLATKPKLDADLSRKLLDQTDYHSKIGSLMYLTSSRPNLVQAVNKARGAQIHWGSLFGKSHNALGYSTFRCYPNLGVLQIGIRAKVIENQPVALPLPDFIPGTEDPQTPPVPQDEDEREAMFIQPHYPDYPLPPVVSPTAESLGYVTESDLEEDPEEYEDDKPEDGLVDYPMDGGGDRDDDDGDSSRDDADDEDEDEGDEDDEDEEEEEEEHLAPADSAVVVPTVELVSPPEGIEPVIPPPIDRSKYEVGESSTARLIEGRGTYYGFVSTVDAEARRQGISEVGVTELAELHERDTQDLYALLEDAQDGDSIDYEGGGLCFPRGLGSLNRIQSDSSS